MKLRGSALMRGVADVIFPPSCVHCRAMVETTSIDETPAAQRGFRHLCFRCAAQLEFVRSPHCTTCGHPFYGILEGERMCIKCEGLDPAFRQGHTAVLFKGLRGRS
jgi:hypothetical protein